MTELRSFMVSFPGNQMIHSSAGSGSQNQSPVVPVEVAQQNPRPNTAIGVDLLGKSNLNPGNTNYLFPARYTKIEFPKFDGEDLEGWLFRCERFFQVDNTPADSQVKLAAIHMEGKALQWHQSFIKGRGGGDDPP